MTRRHLARLGASAPRNRSAPCASLEYDEYADTILKRASKVVCVPSCPVDTIARRISCFDKRSIAAAKRLVNEISLPPAGRFLDAFNSFGTALSWPETQTKVGQLLKRGLQTDTEFEKRWPEVLDTL